MNTNSNDEIDLIDLLKKLYNSRKLIVYITIVFSIMGIAFALLLPVKYSSTTIFITQKSFFNIKYGTQKIIFSSFWKINNFVIIFDIIFK